MEIAAKKNGLETAYSIEVGHVATTVLMLGYRRLRRIRRAEYRVGCCASPQITSEDYRNQVQHVDN